MQQQLQLCSKILGMIAIAIASYLMLYGLATFAQIVCLFLEFEREAMAPILSIEIGFNVLLASLSAYVVGFYLLRDHNLLLRIALPKQSQHPDTTSM